MADCGLSQVGFEVGKSFVTECLWPPIKRHFGYCWHFRDNIQGLRVEIDSLERRRLNMDKTIEDSRLCVESATDEVKKWSDEGTQKIEQAKRILRGCESVKCWNIISRYSMGKTAKETTEEITKHRDEANSIRISDPAPPPSMAPIPHGPTTGFASRRRVEEDIMKALCDNDVRMIAICGAGGVGKTTMVQRIEDRARKDQLFDEVVHVVVSQKIDMLEIQKKIADLLGLKFSEDTLPGRAHKLHTRLMDSKRKLIIFDDVWKRFSLRDLGVPFGSDLVFRCKIILTSRIKDVCEEMEAQKIVEIEVLDKSEMWELFREKSGDCVDDFDLRPIAEDVAAECGGLPIALITVGTALRNKSIYVWKNALAQLRRANPTDFSPIKHVYKQLKLSYDYLENESEKSLFLLCCLFPEDYEFETEILTMYSFGLGMFKGINNIDDGRNRTHDLVDRLKDRFLLMDGSSKDCVKMHDVVRDVAIFIGVEVNVFSQSLEVPSMDSSIKDSSRNWVSIDDVSIKAAKLSLLSDFSNLRLLMIFDSPEYDKSEAFDAISFNGVDELKVLTFSNVRLLPPTVGLLKKLRTLHLYDSTVDDISITGELTSLEILSICSCPLITELPAHIGRLNRLRLLELNECSRLKRVVPGVISSLVGLEELTIIESFKEWEGKGEQRIKRNAGLSELECLRNLTSLEIEIADPNLVHEEVRLPQRLVRYRIDFGKYTSDSGMNYERKMTLDFPRDITLGSWVRELVRRAQMLQLSGSNNISLADIESGLKALVLHQIPTVKKLANALDDKFPMLEHLNLSNLDELEAIVDGRTPEGFNSFRKLESLYLFTLPKLAHLWKSVKQNVWLGNLKSMSVYDCPNLLYLFSIETVRSLVQLRDLYINDCEKMEHLFLNEMESNADASLLFEFPNLKVLKLQNLPKFVSFSRVGVETIHFPRCTELEIDNCPKLEIKIGNCPNLTTIRLTNFNSFTACCSRGCNTKLEDLEIGNSENMEEIFLGEIKDHVVFQELWGLRLRDLPFLTTFCRGVESIKFPRLNRMTIGNLARLDSLLPMDSEVMHEHDLHSLHLFCNPKVEIHGLETLNLFKVHDSISKIWCRRIPTDFFGNLKILRVSDINGIKNLMSSSIAKNLVNLEYLEIDGCKEMVEVIEDENEGFLFPLFPKLEVLSIESLGNLRSFCQWKHVLEFPSLNKVRIRHCPQMETFTLGSVSTPNLSTFVINGEYVETVESGLNNYFMTKTEDKNYKDDEDEDEGEDEDEDDDGEDDDGDDDDDDERLKTRKRVRI